MRQASWKNDEMAENLLNIAEIEPIVSFGLINDILDLAK